MRRTSLHNLSFSLLFTLVLLLGADVSGTTQTLSRYQFPDGSGAVSLAPGWKILNAGNGAVAAKGASGAISLGIPLPVVSRNVAAQFPDIPDAALFPGSLRVTFNDPARAAVDMMRSMDRQSPGSIRNIKIKAIEYIPVKKGKAVFMRYAVTLNGIPTEAFGLYTLLPVDATQGLFVYSIVCASKATYGKALPTMMAMWNSWSLSDATIRKRLQGAAAALGAVDVVGAMSEENAHRRRVAEAAAAACDAYVRQ